jgi:hypothetical protein
VQISGSHAGVIWFDRDYSSYLSLSPSDLSHGVHAGSNEIIPVIFLSLSLTFRLLCVMQDQSALRTVEKNHQLQSI